MNEYTAPIAISISYVLDNSYKTILIDCVDNERVTLSTTLTQYPVVTGEVVADHAIHDPVEMSISGLYSMNSSSIQNTDSALSIKSFQSEIERLRNESVLCTVTKQTTSNSESKFISRSNMVINNIQWTQGANSVEFTLSMKEVLMSTVQENVTLLGMPAGNEIYVQNAEAKIDNSRLVNLPNKPVFLADFSEGLPKDVTDAAIQTLETVAEDITPEVQQYFNDVYKPALTLQELVLPKKVAWSYWEAKTYITIGHDEFQFKIVPSTADSEPIRNKLDLSGLYHPMRIMIYDERGHSFLTGGNLLKTVYASSACTNYSQMTDDSRIIPAQYTDYYVYLLIESLTEDTEATAVSSMADFVGQRLVVVSSKKSIQSMNNELARLSRKG